MSFGERLKEVIDDKKISKDDLSLYTNIGIRQINKYINNERLPSIRNILAISDFLKVSINYLLGVSMSDNYTNNYISNSFLTVFENLLKSNKTNNSNVCKKANISRCLYYDWKKGAIPNCYTLMLLAEHFGVSVDYLLGKEF